MILQKKFFPKFLRGAKIMSELFEFEISEELKTKGISLVAKDGNTVLIKYNDIPIRATIYSQDINKTVNAIEKKCKKFINDKIIIQNIFSIISKYWNRFIDSNDTDDEELKSNDLESQQHQTISYEDWYTGLLERYNRLLNLVKEKYPELSKPLEFALSVKSILNIKDCTLPFIGIILGPPSSVKTLTIEIPRGSNHTYYTDNFSAKAFVSHNTSVKREELQEIDMLPKIKNKLFLTPELSPTFSKKDEELNEILGIITRIADGHGYESDSGAQGHRGYTGEYMFTWLGAAVDIPRKVHKLLGTLGPKLYFYRLTNRERKEEDYLEKLKDSDNFQRNLTEIKKLFIDYIEWYQDCPIMDKSESARYNLIKVEWDSTRDDKQSLLFIIRLAKLLAYLRGVVPTWETRDTQGSDYAYTFATKEEPYRAMIQLRNLARGHASSQGRNYIAIQDIPIVIQTVLSTASRERTIIFDCLLKNNGKLTTDEIKESLNITAPTALRTMTEFTALELVDKITLGREENAPIQIQLKDDFSWFLTDEFRELRSGFGEEYIKEYLEEKQAKKSKTEAGESLDENKEHKEKIPPSRINFYNTEEVCCKEYYPIMVYNKNQLSIQPNPSNYSHSNRNEVK